MARHHLILSLVYNEFEALDLFGPLGAIIPRNDYYTLKLVNIHDDRPAPTNGLESSIKNGVGVLPTLSLSDALDDEEKKEEEGEGRFTTLFIPGGLGMRPLVHDPVLLRRIGQLVDRAANVFTVCTGSILLAATGRLDGRRATTNKRAFDQLTPSYTGVQWQKRARWVHDGKFLTSSGITAGIDAAFAFISHTYVSPADREANPTMQEASVVGDATVIPGFDKEKALEHAQSVAFHMEYRWHSDPEDDPFVGEFQSSV